VSDPADPCRLGVDLLILVIEYSDKLLEATVVAAVTCVFQCLSHTSGPTLGRALLIVDKVRALNMRTAESVLYDRAKIFFDQYPRMDNTRTGQYDGDVRSKDVSEDVEAFSSRLIATLLEPKTNKAEPKSARMKRAVLAVTYANSNCASASELEWLTTALEQWLDTERSRPIRESVHRALLALKKSGSQASGQD
jgi:hypothetical protein